MPSARSGGLAHSACAAAGMDGSVYVVGGRGPPNFQVFDVAERFDPAVRRWERVPSMRTPRDGGAATMADGLLYVCGGYQELVGLDNPLGMNINRVERFSPASGQWEELPPMPTARHGCAAATVEGKIYVVGGEGDKGTLDTVEMFNPVLGTWRSLPPMLNPRSACAAVAAFGKLYVFGGKGRKELLNTAEVFNPATGTWAALAQMPTARSGCAAGKGW